MKWIRLVMLTLPLMASGAWAHGGGLNKDGCHNDRKNGGYHCHRSNTPLQSQINSAPRAQFTSGTTSSASNARARSFANCSEARDAGAAPVHRGDPGYGPHLDRDNDGIGCEPYKGR